MSGRIWVVEYSTQKRTEPNWRPLQFARTRSEARLGQEGFIRGSTRVVQYVRQGGAR